jgi:hypothetical protein
MEHAVVSTQIGGQPERLHLRLRVSAAVPDRSAIARVGRAASRAVVPPRAGVARGLRHA